MSDDVFSPWEITLAVRYIHLLETHPGKAIMYYRKHTVELDRIWEKHKATKSEWMMRKSLERWGTIQGT